VVPRTGRSTDPRALVENQILLLQMLLLPLYPISIDAASAVAAAARINVPATTHSHRSSQATRIPRRTVRYDCDPFPHHVMSF
jgi:hypothetical protein